MDTNRRQKEHSVESQNMFQQDPEVMRVAGIGLLLPTCSRAQICIMQWRSKIAAGQRLTQIYLIFVRMDGVYKRV